MIYARKKVDEREEIECDSLKEAKEKAIKDWATGSYFPLHISDDGKQIVGHADLREFLLKKTGIGKWKPISTYKEKK